MGPLRWVLVGVAGTLAVGAVALVELLGVGITALSKAECPDDTSDPDDLPPTFLTLDPLTP